MVRLINGIISPQIVFQNVSIKVFSSLFFFQLFFFFFNKTWLYGAICIVLLTWSIDTDLSEPFFYSKYGISWNFTEFYGVLPNID